MIPTIGQKYLVKHTSGLRVMTFIGLKKRETVKLYSRVFPDCDPIVHRGYTHYIFRNDSTGRDIELKSTAKIRKAID